MINVTVRFFNLLAACAGNKIQAFELADGTTISQLVARMANDYPPPFKELVYHQEKISPHLRIFLNERLLYVSELDNALMDGDSLMLFPAIAGG